MPNKRSMWDELDEAFPILSFEELMKEKARRKLERAKTELRATLSGGRA